LNLSEHRNIIAPVLIALAGCAGGYVAFVEPRERNLREARVAIASLEQQQATTQRIAPDVARLALMHENALKIAGQTRARAGAGATESGVFETIMSLAAEASVRVESMTPNGTTTAGPAQATAPIAPMPGVEPVEPPPQDRLVRYSIEISGEYDNVVRFVERVQASMGFTNVRGVRIAARAQPGQRTLSATVDTEHLMLDPRTIAALNDVETRP